ncbi:MAG TPA: hypothetical protein DEQ28_01470 [Clostridiales bacterium]|nr:hypothetical protein [Clostridiales bacterium]
MEELIGLIIFTLIMRMLGAGRRPARKPAPAEDGRRQAGPPAKPAAARPAVQPVAGERVFDLRELLREAFPAAVAPVRPAKIRTRQRPEAPPPPQQQPERAAVKATAPVPAETPAAGSASPIPGFHELGEPGAAARAVVLGEIFGAPRCRNAHRPPWVR